MPDLDLMSRAKSLLARVPGLYQTASIAYRSRGLLSGFAYVAEHAPVILKGGRPIVITYPSVTRPRWGYGMPGHVRLQAIIEEGRPRYEALLRSLGTLRASIEAIPDDAARDDAAPPWTNGFFTGIDAAGLYGMLAIQKPKRYFEIGSGYSTKFARRAIADHGLTTTLLSIDPSPQATVDVLCDTVIRQGLEDVDLTLFDQLEAGCSSTALITPS